MVVSDKAGTIAGLDYNIVSAVISSFKSEEQREKKLKYEENKELPMILKLASEGKLKQVISNL